MLSNFLKVTQQSQDLKPYLSLSIWDIRGGRVYGAVGTAFLCRDGGWSRR